MKKLLNYLPFHFLVCIIIGIITQFYTSTESLDFTFQIVFLGGFISVLLALKKLQYRKLFSITTLLFFIFLGYYISFSHNPKSYTDFYQNHLKNKTQTTTLSIRKVLKENTYSYKFIAEVSRVDSIKTRGFVLLSIKKDSLPNLVSIDDVIIVNTPFTEINKALNPHQFDYKDYLAKQYVYQQIHVKKYQYLKIENTTFSIYGLATKFRNTIKKSLAKHHFSKDELSVINALLLGERQEISKELLQSYTNAGAIHILAISGLHIGIIFLLLTWILKPLLYFKNGSLTRTFCVVILLWMFAFIAGLSASVVRAVTMFTFVALGESFKQKKIIEHSLISSMLILLLFKPLFIFDVGFQLSYLAVFGIIWIQPLLYNLWIPKYYLLDKFWSLLTVSVAAQIGILPISLYYFHQFPALFFIANLLIIPFLGTILFVGITVILLSLIDMLPDFLIDAYSGCIRIMNWIVTWVSHQESFLFQEISMSFILMLAWYFLSITLYQTWVQKSYKNILATCIAIILLQLIYGYEKHQQNTKKELVVFHKNKKSVLGKRNGKVIELFTSDENILQESALKSYRIGEDVLTKKSDSAFNIVSYKNQFILIVDSLGIYQINNLKNPLVLLQYSPKINLKRLISTLQPSQIIADGSNYKSYVKGWKNTCLQTKIPFYYTEQNGAFNMVKN